MLLSAAAAVPVPPPTAASLLHFSVVAAAALFAAWGIWRAFQVSPNRELEGLSDRFKEDIRSRAFRGSEPDWTHYETIFERVYTTCDEELRSLSSANLTLGVLATLSGVFLIGYFGDFDHADTIRQFGTWALLGNGLLVTSGLVIQRWISPRRLREVTYRLNELRTTLQAFAADYPAMGRDPATQQVIATRAMKEALGGVSDLLEKLGEQLDKSMKAQASQMDKFAVLSESLETAATRMTEAVEALGPLRDKVDALNGTVERVPELIRREMVTANAALRSSLDATAAAFATTASESAGTIATATSTLHARLDGLNTSLAALPGTLVGALGSASAEFAQRLEKTTSALESNATNLNNSLAALPAELGEAVTSVSQTSATHYAVAYAQSHNGILKDHATVIANQMAAQNTALTNNLTFAQTQHLQAVQKHATSVVQGTVADIQKMTNAAVASLDQAFLNKLQAAAARMEQSATNVSAHTDLQRAVIQVGLSAYLDAQQRASIMQEAKRTAEAAAQRSPQPDSSTDF